MVREYEAIDRLIDECRVRSLWYLRADYYPATDEERLRVLEAIERSADMVTFVRARELREWLLHRSSGQSAAS